MGEAVVRRNLSFPLQKMRGMTSELQLQQLLFPLDPWGCERVFVVVDHPHPAIARAIVGPLILGRDRYSGPQLLRCIALHSSRHFLFSAQISANFRVDTEKFWTIVASHFRPADLCRVGVASEPWAVTPKDSVKHWSGSAFWMTEAVSSEHLHNTVYVLSKLLARHDVDGHLVGETDHPLRYEHLALIHVNDQLVAAMEQLFQAMVPELRAAYTRRPRLSTGLVNRLMALAQADGVQATKYMLQAIQTESFGLLHLMAFDDGCPDAHDILQVVLSGGSLPTKFLELGVSKGVHRRTLFRPDHPDRQKPSPPLDISSLNMPGVQWLAAMRLTQRQPIYSLEDWQALGHMLEQLPPLDLSDLSLYSALMTHCVKVGYKTCGAVLKRLISNAQALMKGAQNMAFISVAFGDAIGIAMEWETHRPVPPVCRSRIDREPDWTEPAELILAVCQVFGLDVQGVMQSTLSTHPGVPTGFSDSTGLLLLPLDSLELTFLHGNRVNNCLENFYSTACYIADGIALYGVEDDGVAVGTIALKRDADQRNPKVEVLKISGQNNDRVGYKLGHLAQSLADKWNTDFDSGVWMRFSTECRRLSPV